MLESLVTGVLGGLGNLLANTSANDRAAMLQDQALQNWIKLQIPNPADQQIALQKFVQQGTLDPKLEKAIKADPSKFESIITSQSVKNAQNRALSELQELGNRGGLRLQDKATLQDAMLAQQAKDRGNRDAIASEMARRGLGGSGFDVAARLQGQQGTSDQMARNSLSAAASAQDRALQSIMGAGDLATKYRTQDFGEQAQRAAAADKINLFNTQNLQDIQNRNIGAQNRAAEMNLNQAQKTADQNTQLSNYQQEYNKKLYQQQFQDQMQRAQGISGATQGLANTAVQQGQNIGNTISGLATGAIGQFTNASNQNHLTDYLEKQADLERERQKTLAMQRKQDDLQSYDY